MQDTALILIDFQNDYFPGGKWELEGIEPAAANAQLLLSRFREGVYPVIHVRHESVRHNAPFFLPGTVGASFHASLTPLDQETAIVKRHINAFLNTSLRDMLNAKHVKKLVFAGAMSHMCVEGSVRAASDFGYECWVAHDACATRTVEFNSVGVSAEQLHAAAMHALNFAFAKVVSTQQWLRDNAA